MDLEAKDVMSELIGQLVEKRMPRNEPGSSRVVADPLPSFQHIGIGLSPGGLGRIADNTREDSFYTTLNQEEV